MSAGQRSIAILVGLLVLVGLVVIVVGLNVGDGGSAANPSASPTRSLAPSGSGSATPSAGASIPGEEETLAALREIERQVIAIRGLEAANIGPPQLITRAELGDELQRIFEQEYPPEDQARDNIALRALGLLQPGQDVAQLQLQLLGDQVLGFYDDVDQRMVVVTDAGLDAEAKLTYAHEYTHALQDAAFGLDSLQTDEIGEDDRGLARTALIEGDATVSMLAWAFAGNLTPEELVEIGSATDVPDTTGIPSWLVDQLQFPYTDGLNWASALAGDPIDPDFSALDDAFADPPDSTEQIIDLDKWDPREAPDDVEAIDLAGALGDGWDEVDATPIGEATIRIMLRFHGVALPDANAAGSGWGGDSAVIASGPDDAFAVTWLLAWDTPTDAAEFEDAYRQVIGTLGFPASVEHLSDGRTLVAHGSDDDILRRAVDAATP
jgi:hypothetical protein